MASFAYTGYKKRLLDAWLAAEPDIRAMLVMSNTTADTDQDANVIADIGTLDEYDGSGYARATLTSEANSKDDANNRAEFTAANFSFGTTVAAGTRQAAGMVLYRHVSGTAATDQVIAYYDSGGFPFAGNGGSISVTVNAEGLLQAT